MADDVFNGETTEGLSDRELLERIVQEQAKHRSDVNSLREQVNAQKKPAPAQTSVVKSQDELREERLAEIRDHSHYCPDCGNLSTYVRECRGLSADKPHPPRDMVSTEELLGDDTSAHTAATESYA